MDFPAYATVLSVYAASVVGRIEAMEDDMIHPHQATKTANTFLTFNTYEFMIHLYFVKPWSDIAFHNKWKK